MADGLSWPWFGLRSSVKTFLQLSLNILHVHFQAPQLAVVNLPAGTLGGIWIYTLFLHIYIQFGLRLTQLGQQLRFS